ncbi:MAG: hypothetical protein LIP00_05130 [Parabacteroides sp.]|nr:hypothetical protein [Parabacteroides sp.]
METKGIETMSKEELTELVGRLYQELENEKFMNKCRAERIARLEAILDSIEITLEAYKER